MGHLDDVNQTYFGHFRRALHMAFRFTIAIPLLLIHAVYPNVFMSAASDVVDVYNQLTEEDPS
ncbi:MAG: DUF6356 family protein [archaeon]|nr:DUF6356 family protein [archaeon]